MKGALSLRARIGFSLFLILLGAGWAFTQPMSKIAVSQGYQHFGLIFWQSVIGFVVMAVLSLAMGRRLPLGAPHLRLYSIIALIGTLIPNSASYQAAVHLPSGLLSILLLMVPIFAFPMALALGTDRFEARRFAGLLVGFGAVMLIVIPGASLPGIPSVFWVFVALISGLFYAFEGNFVAKWGTGGLDPIQVLWGASLVGMILSLPLALLTGQWINPLPPYGAPDYAHIASSVIHVLVYSGYVWLVGQVGAIFAAQVSYFVTLFGVFWARLILGETYAPQIWLALCVMLLAMYLLQPRRQSTTV